MMAQAFITRRKGGGGVNKDLPAQVTAFTATTDSTPSITLSWQNPSEYWAGTLIVKKAGSAPEGVNDGEKIYKGEGTSYTDFDVSFDTEYFYRAFPFNEKKQYQTAVNVASAKPVAGIALSELAEGALVNINESGTAVPFYLAKHDYESGLNGAGRQLMVKKDTTTDQVTQSVDAPTSYADGLLDKWTEEEYKPLFSEAVQNMMGKTTFYYSPDSNSTTVSTLIRSVFHPSITEYGLTSSSINIEGSALPIYQQLQVAPKWQGTNVSASHVFTRSIRRKTNTSSSRLAIVKFSSTVEVATGSGPYWARPCFTLPATALVNPTPNADGSYTLIETA